MSQKTIGQTFYEAELKEKPIYPDGVTRKTWEELPDWAKDSWQSISLELTTHTFNEGIARCLSNKCYFNEHEQCAEILHKVCECSCHKKATP